MIKDTPMEEKVNKSMAALDNDKTNIKMFIEIYFLKTSKHLRFYVKIKTTK